MTSLTTEQAFSFIVMFFSGIAIALLRQLYNFLQNRYKAGRILIFVQEMLFWLLCAILVSSSLYFCCFGVISVHSLLGFTLGAGVWYNISRLQMSERD
jgi:spore cortex biosynthesis protein YabQ